MRSWRSAWEAANLAFYSQASPAEHFRTSAAYPAELARAVLLNTAPHLGRVGLLAPDALHALGRGTGRKTSGPTAQAALCSASVATSRHASDPQRIDIVDVGGDDARVARHLAAQLAEVGVPTQVRILDLRAAEGVTVGVAPAALQDLGPITGLLLAHEWLDDVACERILIGDDGRARVLLNDEAAGDVPGPKLTDRAGCAEFGVDSDECQTWLQRWAPHLPTGAAVEIGASRDHAWASCLGAVSCGVALAVDYAIDRRQRRDRPSTVAAYRHGQRVPITMDGTANVTAHVAFDAVVARTSRHAGTTVLRRQRECVDAATPQDDAGRAAGELSALARASRVSALRATGGLGSFRWLLQVRDRAAGTD